MIRPLATIAVVLGLFLGWSGCRYNPEPVETAIEAVDAQLPGLGAEATNEQIADFLIALEDQNKASDQLAILFPNLDRERAYAIQLAAMNQRIGDGDRLIGWKMGGTRVTEAAPTPDPSFGYLLESDRFEPGAEVRAGRFIDGSPMIEAEIAVHIGEDLRGPEVSLSELMNAISGVSASTEFISVRLLTPTLEPAPINHMIAGRLSHAGVQVLDAIIPLASLDMVNEEGFVRANGEEVARGAAYQIMGSSPLDAVLWLANELPKHDLFLRSGDFVITGSLLDNPTLEPGQKVEVAFSSLGSIEAGVASQ